MTTETLTARLARLRNDYAAKQEACAADPDDDETDVIFARIALSNALIDACEEGQLIALDVPASGEPARVWCAIPTDGVHEKPEALYGWQLTSSTENWDYEENDTDPCEPIEYIAVSALRGALLAAKVKGFLEAAEIAGYHAGVVDDRAPYGNGYRHAANTISKQISDAAAKLEAEE